VQLTVISDTHGRHEALGSLEGDVLIHCGDFCDGFTEEPAEVERVDAWFAEQEFELILCVGGNHDFAVVGRIKKNQPVFRNAVWLQDAAHSHRGVTFFGSPWVPFLQGWAFYMSEQGLGEKWAMIPDRTDVLITHTPPYGVLDQSRGGARNLGCPQLLERVEAVAPRFHLFGHVHASAGIEERGATTFVNAAVVSSALDAVREPVMIDLDRRRDQP
jgi:Icc-related predicted phosphoesterase